jgi:hypothetical protein
MTPSIGEKCFSVKANDSHKPEERERLTRPARFLRTGTAHPERQIKSNRPGKSKASSPQIESQVPADRKRAATMSM